MALINCPECGRKNVSNTAESCPSCGYNIKAYYEKENQLKQQQDLFSNHRYEKEVRYKDYETNIKAEHKKIDDLTEPKKPNFIHLIFDEQVWWLSSAILIGPILTFLFCIFVGSDNILLLLYIIFGIFASPIWLIICYSDYKTQVINYNNELKLYKTNRADWEKEKERKKAFITEHYKVRAHMEIENKYSQQSKKENQLKCPVCNSTDIEKITTLDRSVSLAMVGLASGKIGKQYKCKKCKHMW